MEAHDRPEMPPPRMAMESVADSFSSLLVLDVVANVAIEEAIPPLVETREGEKLNAATFEKNVDDDRPSRTIGMCSIALILFERWVWGLKR